MAKLWRATYKGHEIRVETGVLGEKLLIDGDLQAEYSGLAFKVNLRSTIPRGDGVGESVEAVLFGWLTVGCKLRIDGQEVQVERIARA